MNHVHMPLLVLLKKHICHMKYWDKTLFIQTTIKYPQALIYVVGMGYRCEHGKCCFHYKTYSQHDIQTSKQVIKIQSVESFNGEGIGCDAST